MKSLIKTTILFSAALFLSISAYAIECENDQAVLNIQVESSDNKKLVYWRLTLKDDPTFSYEAQGEWHKEVESEDAFSAFNEQTAISYKNQRAVFILPDDQAIYFPACR